MNQLKQLLAKLGIGKKKSYSTKQKEKVDPFATLSAGVVVAVVVVVLLSVFVIYPTIKTINDVNEAISQNQDLLLQLQQKNAALAKAQKDRDAHTAELEKLDYSIPNEPLYVKDLTILEKIASETTGDGEIFALAQMSIGKIPQEQVQTKTARAYIRTEMPIGVTFRSDYNSTQAFLKRIKQNLRNFTIEQVVFSAPSNKNQNTLDVTVRLNNIYYSAY